MEPTYRPAISSDAGELLGLRRGSILALAPRGMPRADAETWAMTLSLDGMHEKLTALEIWVAEAGCQILGWVAFTDDRLEGLYVGAAFAQRGVGSGLLALTERVMRERKIPAMRALASANAIGFYLRLGFEPTAPLAADGTQRIVKRLDSA